MKFTVSRSLLAEQLSILKGLIETKSHIQILSFIHIKADTRLWLKIVTGLSRSQLTLDIDADVTSPGEILLPGELFTEVVETYAGDNITFEYDKPALQLESTRKDLSVTCGRTTTHFAMVPVGEFVPPMVIKGNYDRWIPAGEFQRAIDFVLFSVADKNNPSAELRSVSFKINKGILELASADGFRLSRSRTVIQEEDLFENIAVTIDGVSMAGLRRVLSGRTDNIAISVHEGDEHIVGFKAPGFEYLTHKGPHQYIEYEKFYPDEFTGSVTLPAKNLVKVAKAIRTMAMGAYFPVITLRSGNGVLQMKTKDDVDEDKSASVTIDAECAGEQVNFSLNGNYLLDCLKAVEKHCEDTDKLVIRCSKSKPAIFEIDGKDAFFYLVMPVEGK